MNTLLASAAFEDIAKPLISYPKDKYSSALQYVLDSTQILPIKSNPCSPDSDGDGIVDCIKYFDKHPNDTKYYRTEFSDPNPLKKEALWQWPVVRENGEKIFEISAAFDEIEDRDPIHRAIDIISANGTPVLASYKGTVTYIDNGCTHNYPKVLKGVSKNTCGCNGYGKFIDIMSEINGKIYLHRYGHLSRIDVKIGDIVESNMQIGTLGSTGLSSGYHTDFSIIEVTAFTISESIGRNHAPKTWKPGWIDPLLFDRYLNIFDKYSYEEKTHDYKMLINIPRNIKSSCTGSKECKEVCTHYIDNARRKYKIGMGE